MIYMHCPKEFVTTGLNLGNSLQLVFAVLLLILGVLVAIQGVKKLLEKPEEKKSGCLVYVRVADFIIKYIGK